MPSAVLGQNGLKKVILQFPAPGGLVGRNIKCTKVAQFQGETFGAAGFRPKSASTTRKLCFSVFGPGPEFLSVPKARNGPKYHWTTVFDRWGSDRKKMFPRKLRKPSQIAWYHFFPRFRDPGPRKGPAVLASLLLAAC